MKHYIESKLSHIVADFKIYNKQFKNIEVVSKSFWVLLQCEPDKETGEVESAIPSHKVAVSGLAEAVANHEMYIELHQLNKVQFPYSYVFVSKSLYFLIQHDGRVFNKHGDELIVPNGRTLFPDSNPDIKQSALFDMFMGSVQ